MAASKFTQKTSPTNRDLQQQAIELHDCLHQTACQVDIVVKQVSMMAKALGVALPSPEEIALGVEPRKVRRRLGGVSPWQAVGFLVPAVAGGVGLYKVIEPAIVAFAMALHHALLTAP